MGKSPGPRRMPAREYTTLSAANGKNGSGTKIYIYIYNSNARVAVQQDTNPSMMYLFGGTVRVVQQNFTQKNATQTPRAKTLSNLYPRRRRATRVVERARIDFPLFPSPGRTSVIGRLAFPLRIKTFWRFLSFHIEHLSKCVLFKTRDHHRNAAPEVFFFQTFKKTYSIQMFIFLFRETNAILF